MVTSGLTTEPLPVGVGAVTMEEEVTSPVPTGVALETVAATSVVLSTDS